MKTLLAFPFAVLVLVAVNHATAQADGKNAAIGKPATSVKNIDASEAAKLLEENKKIVVLDVRTPDEFAAGHIAGATNINFNDPKFKERIVALDKSKPYLVHCAAGGRSAKAREILKELQFQSIYHLDGGLKAWEKAGKPVVR
jgi:rhodanese-related sulfurtransferase